MSTGSDLAEVAGLGRAKYLRDDLMHGRNAVAYLICPNTPNGPNAQPIFTYSKLLLRINLREQIVEIERLRKTVLIGQYTVNNYCNLLRHIARTK